MKKTIYSGSSEKFDSDNFRNLMMQIGAEEVGKKHVPYDDSGFCRRGRAELFQFYHLEKENVMAVYHNWSDSHIDSEIILSGNSENIEGVEKKVLEAIASIKFDAERFRKN
jgi:hypothetical protein